MFGGGLTAAVDAVARLPKPVVAAVTGYAPAVAWNWRSRPTSGSSPTMPCSGCRRSPSGSSGGGRYAASAPAGRDHHRQGDDLHRPPR